MLMEEHEAGEAGGAGGAGRAGEAGEAGKAGEAGAVTAESAESAEAEAVEMEELIFRIPLELHVASDISLYDLQRMVSARLAEAELLPRQDPMSMLLGLNGQVCGDPLACPLRMLVPGSVVSFVADLQEAHEVSRLGLCLNAFQLMQVQLSGFAPQSPQPFPSPMVGSPAMPRPRKLLPDDVMEKRRKELYKTVLCTNFTGPNRHCSFGDRCHFAHGKAELRAIGQPTTMVTANVHGNSSQKDEPAEDSKDAAWNWSEKTEWKWEGWESWDTDKYDKWKYDNSDWKWNRDWSQSWGSKRDWSRDRSRDWWSGDWSPQRARSQSNRSNNSNRSKKSDSGGLVLGPVDQMDQMDQSDRSDRRSRREHRSRAREAREARERRRRRSRSRQSRRRNR